MRSRALRDSWESEDMLVTFSYNCWAVCFGSGSADLKKLNM
jgi:hypothetical protein